MGNILYICKKIINDRSTFDLSLYFPGMAINKKKSQDWYDEYVIEEPNCIAIIDYDKQDSDEINLSKNDFLILVNSRVNRNYILIKNLRTQSIGKVPREAVKPYSQLRNKP